MAKEPLKTEQKNKTGRPEYSDGQYQEWLKDLKPHLELACSLYRACIKAGLEYHYKAISRKYNLNDWFCQKVNAYRASFGEDINEALAKETERILEKAKRQDVLTREEIDILKHMSEKHRTAQPFFVTRFETAEAKDEDIGKILDTIEASDYENVGQQAKGQMVATNAPIQNQEQTGEDNNIQTESTPTQVPSPEGDPPVQ